MFQLFNIYLGAYQMYGFDVLSIETEDDVRNLLAVVYSGTDLWIDLLFFRFEIKLK